MDHLQGKVVAITGASRGIGAAAARFLANNGARVILGARNGAATIYTDSRQGGASRGLNRAVPDLSRYRFNDNASSIDIRSGKWELCEHANYQGRCQIVDASKERLNGLRLNDNVSSIRPVEGTVPPGTGRRGGRRGGDAGMRDDRGQG